MWLPVIYETLELLSTKFDSTCNCWYLWSEEYGFIYVNCTTMKGTTMKIRLSQLFFVLPQPKLYAHFKILFSLMFFTEAIVILYFMYCFWRNTPTYLPTIAAY